MTTRRQFLRETSALAVAAALAPATVLAKSWRPGTVSLDQITFADFAAQRDTTFRVLAANVPVADLDLIRAGTQPADDYGQGPAPDDRNEKFALLFRGRRTQPLPQDTYGFEQPSLGRFDMFIVPIGGLDQRYCFYEAIFNRRAAMLT